MCDLAEKAQRIKDELIHLIDADTEAFNEVVKAMRMAKDTNEQRAVRAQAMSDGYKTAAEVPLRTAQLCRQAIDVCLLAAKIGNEAVLSDAGVGALMAFAGVQGAVYNVKINLPQIKDEKFVAGKKQQIANLVGDAKTTLEAVQSIVDRQFD